ncbi:hypothetical protein QR680_009362 [Steinernema hermaphroditum]|uniref:Uncharacterized protein n=1 Tax=Steinernema hermaphroditum TaxID=289476 RepID=A0AA39IMF4_9BILA|nr:hypothetical protein QR680_009362 [Steinernema hermaphroditum]
MEVDLDFGGTSFGDGEKDSEAAVPKVIENVVGEEKSSEERRLEEKRRLRREMILAKTKGTPKIQPFVKIDLGLRERQKELNAWYGSKFDGPRKTQKKSPTMTVTGRSGFKHLALMKQKMSEKIEQRTLQGLEKRHRLFKEDNPDAEQHEGEESEEELEKEKPGEGTASKPTSKDPLNSDDKSDYDENKHNFEEESSGSDDDSDENESTGEPSEKKTNENLESDDEDDAPETIEKSIRRMVLSDDEEESNHKRPELPGENRAEEAKQSESSSPVNVSSSSIQACPTGFKVPQLPRRVNPNDSYDMLSFSQFDPSQIEAANAEKKPVNPLGLVSQSIDDDELLLLCSGGFPSDSAHVQLPTVTKEAMKFDTKVDVLNKHAKSIEKEKGDETQKVAVATDFGNLMKASAPEAESDEDVAPKNKKVPKLNFDSDSDSDDEKEEMDAETGSQNTVLLDEEARDGFEPDRDETMEQDTNDAEDSDDEVAEYRKIYKKSNFYDEEASLSGDDVGSDADSDGDDNDEYEIEEGDADDVPDSEVLRADLQKQFIKQQQDEEDRRLLYLQDKFIAEGDIYSSTDRNFRFKLRDEEDAKVDVEEEEKENNPEKEEEAETHDNEAEESQKRAEKAAWLLSKQEEVYSSNAVFGFDELEERSSMLQTGALALKKKVGYSELVSRMYSGGNRDSMLQNSDSLGIIMKESSSASNIAPHSLFTVMPSVGKNAKRPFKGTTTSEKPSKRARAANIFESFDS